MQTEHSKDDGSDSVKCWYVRNEQGRRFGPADFATLQEWARDGRIGPLNEISCDGARWVLASDMPAMQMDWVAAMAAGAFYGPIHAGAMRGLLDEGAIKADAPLFRRDSLDAGGKQVSEEELERLRATVDRLRDLNAGHKRQLKQAREKLDAQTDEIESLRRQVLATAEKSKLEIAQEQERARHQAEKYAAETAEIKRLLQEQVEQAQERHQHEAARAEALEDVLGRLRGELSAAMARTAQLQEDFDNQCRLREEERSVYEKRVTAALEETEAALEREKELQGRISAFEQVLSVAADGCADDEARDVAGACADGAGADGRETEYVEAEPLDDDAHMRKSAVRPARVVEEADVLPPETRDANKCDKHVTRPEAAMGPIMPAAGISMAALEAQARRELAMLGSDARMFFSKTRK